MTPIMGDRSEALVIVSSMSMIIFSQDWHEQIKDKQIKVKAHGINMVVS